MRITSSGGGCSTSGITVYYTLQILMKQLLLVKQSPFIDLAHLYEHLFCTRIQELFYTKHLFERLDYNLEGRMYQGGLIYIDLELYTPAAIELADKIKSLELVANEETLFIAVAQLLAEKEEPVASTGYENVKNALESLHAQPWRNLDDIELIDTQKVRKKTGSFYITEGESIRSRQLTTSVLLDADFAISNRELLPLFRQLAYIIIVNCQNILAAKYGYYSSEDAYKKTKDTVGVTNIFKIADVEDISVDIADVLRSFHEVVSDLRQYGVFSRYMDELRTVSYYDRPNLAPSPEKNYEDISILVGAKGWRKIATEENYKLLLKHMSLEVRLGRNKKSISV
jgi:hypothetical protein